MKVLLIEDDALLMKALNHKLAEWGHEVYLASNGQEAIEALDSHMDIEAIICDVLMPVISGPTFLLALENHFPKALPLLIVISAVKEGEEFLKSIAIKYDHFLPKPVDFEKLKALLQKQKANA